MLTPAANVPQMLCGDVAGLDGTRAAVDLPADVRDRCTLWVIGPSMAQVQLDAARMVEGGREPPALDRPVGPNPLGGL